jgi:hypothetical protein
VAESEAKEEAQPTRNAAASRGAKRKAAAKTVDSDEESPGGFENVGEESDIGTEAATPEPLEDSGNTTEDDDDDNEAAQTPRMAKTIGNRTSELKPAGRQSRPTKSIPDYEAAKKPPSTEKPEATSAEIPPRQKLPFQEQKAAQQADKKLSREAPAASASSAQQSSVPAADDGTTDDEL